VARPSVLTGERPSGHRVDAGHRDVGGGILGSQPPRLVTSMIPDNDAPRLISHDSDVVPTPRSLHLPKLSFPVFDGDNPRLWRDRCNMYFEVFAVSAGLKTRFAALNFKGPAAA